MIKISDRLKVIASKIKVGETMADIGTDHGFLPLYLWEEGISPKAIMCDVSQGSLDKAIELIKDVNHQGMLECRLGDGLEVIEKGEVDVCVMAGIGGLLITEIMEWDLEKTLTIKRFVLQPRNNVAMVRKWLHLNGFQIVSEELVAEGENICEIIEAASPNKAKANEMSNYKLEPMSEEEYTYPDYLADMGQLGKIYLARKLEKAHRIKKRIEEGANNLDSNIKYEQCNRSIRRLSALLDKIEVK